MAAVYDPATGKVKPTRVTVGINNNVTAEIQDGLTEGEQVVATGVTRSGNRSGRGQNGQGAGAQNGQSGQSGNPRGNRGGLGRFGGGPPGGVLGF